MAGTSSARDSNESLAQAMARMMDQMLQERDNVADLLPSKGLWTPTDALMVEM